MSSRALNSMKETLKIMEPGRAELRQVDLSPELLRYHKSISKRFSNPIVELRNGTCLGCFINLSSGQRQELEAGDGYGVCEACGRILYVEEY